MLLVTTALEKTWGQTQKILFLGGWCKLYARKHIWQTRSHETLDYNWDDKELLRSDSIWLDKAYEQLLPELTDALNGIHGTSHTDKYWRVLVGPWLGFFIQIAFQRWSSIENATRNFTVSETILITDRLFYLVPNDILEFVEFFSGDEWNHYICGRIIQFQNKLTCHFLSQDFLDKDITPTPKKYSLAYKSKRFLLVTWNMCLLPFTSNKDSLFVATGLPKIKELLLKIRMGQMPQYSMSVDVPKITINADLRRWRLVGSGFTDFEAFIREIIPSQIPKAYVEGYGEIIKSVKSLRWPKSPKIIFTAVGHVYDDVAKLYMADKLETGSGLVIGQHGGGAFHATNFQTEHELMICNQYLSPGIGNTWHPKVRSVGQLFARRWVSNRSGNGLLMQLGTPRYSFSISSTYQSDDFNKYMVEQERFVMALPSQIRNSFTVRLTSTDNLWGSAQRWGDLFPEVLVDQGAKDIHLLFSEAKIIVCTYAGTTYNQTLAANAPTLIFWNRKYERLHTSVDTSLEELIRVGIFHETPESAAAHITRIWGNIDAWWLSAEVQYARERYCLRYAYLPADLLNRIETALREAMLTTSQNMPVPL